MKLSIIRCIAILKKAFGSEIAPIASLFLLLLGSYSSALAQARPDQLSNQQILEAIALDPQPERNFYINDLRIELLKQQLQKTGIQSNQSLVRLRKALAIELLRAGQSIEAIEELGRIAGLLNGLPEEEALEIEFSLEWLLATAYLRVGEQFNCLINHQAQSCIFPISKSALHIATEGSTRATQYLTKILNREADNLAARWLLNLAYMTLGQYPDQVPAKWLLSPKLFSSDKQLAAFNDIAGSLGVDHNGLAGGAVVDDLNGDGYMDIAVTSWDPRAPMKLYMNNADGSFRNTTDKAKLSTQLGGLNLTQADYDNDGDIDLFVFRGAWLGTLGEPLGNHPNSLLQNDGHGRFNDVTLASGLGGLHPVHSGAWADFDLDGNLDLFLGNESAQDPQDPNVINAHRYQLFKGDGAGGFADVAQQQGLAGIGFVKGVAWGDIDNDGYPDLYISRLGQSNQLFRNVEDANGSRKFEDISKSAGVSEPILSFPVWFWDFDNDGWEDLFVASYTSFLGSDLNLVVADYLGETSGLYSRLYRNSGDGTFEDVTIKLNMNQVLLAMGANYGD